MLIYRYAFLDFFLKKGIHTVVSVEIVLPILFPLLIRNRQIQKGRIANLGRADRQIYMYMYGQHHPIAVIGKARGHAP